MNTFTVWHNGDLDRHVACNDTTPIDNTLNNILSPTFKGVTMCEVELSTRDYGYLLSLKYHVEETDIQVQVEYQGHLDDYRVEQILTIK